MILKLRQHYPVLIFLLFFFFLYATLLISRPLPFFDWDESIYAQVGKEMIQTGSWHIPVWRGDVWLDKPPLVPLFYGLIMTLTPGILPEITTRIVTLLIATWVLGMVYMLYYRVVRETWLSTLVTIVTAWTPIILQRALVLNIDIFLLAGWLGYILFFHRPRIRLFFLIVAVMSKSLIGFYAPAIMLLFLSYQFYRKKIRKGEYFAEVKITLLQCLVPILWYMAMFVLYGSTFWQQHIYESHMRRVTASIESHFGLRTYYIDLLVQVYNKYIWLALIGLFAVIWRWWDKLLTNEQLLHALYLLPWFLFLNLTKTKIFWYSHPYIPQFAFLMVYGISLLRRYKLIYFSVIVAAMCAINYQAISVKKLHLSAYSSYDTHHAVATYAKTKCNSLGMLVGAGEREKIATLENLGLTITTTTWWGEHPSMVYYYGKRVEYLYSFDQAETFVNDQKSKRCIAIYKDDATNLVIPQRYQFLKKIDNVYLYRNEE